MEQLPWQHLKRQHHLLLDHRVGGGGALTMSSIHTDTQTADVPVDASFMWRLSGSN